MFELHLAWSDGSGTWIARVLSKLWFEITPGDLQRTDSNRRFAGLYRFAQEPRLLDLVASAHEYGNKFKKPKSQVFSVYEMENPDGAGKYETCEPVIGGLPAGVQEFGSHQTGALHG